MNRPLAPSPRSLTFALALLLTAFLAEPSGAQNVTWSSANYTLGNTFSTGNNWAGGIAPTGTDTAVFNNAGDQLISVGNATALGGMLFSSNTSFSNSYVFNVGANAGFITRPGAVIQTDSTYRGIVGIAVGTGGSDMALSLNGSLTLSSNGLAGSGIVINRITTRPDSGAVTLTLDGTNSGFRGQYGNILSNTIAQGTNSTLSLVKNGPGTWFLNTANTYTGGTTINGGTIVVGNAGSLGTSGSITIGGNSTIVTVAGLTDPSSRITIGDNATLTMDTAGVNQAWAGVLGNSGGSNTAGLTKTGLAQLQLLLGAGQKQTYRGATTINAGLLFLDGSSQTANFTNLIDPSSRLVLGGGSLYYGGATGFTSSQTFNGTTLNAGVSEIRPRAGVGTNLIDLGTIARNDGSLLFITSAGGYTYAATGTANSAGGLVRGVVIGSDFVTNNGTNLVAATYTSQNNASLWTSGTANYQTTGAITGSVGTATINSLRLSNASNQTVNITGTLSVNDGIIFTSTIGANTSRITGGNLTGPSGGGDLIIVNNGNQTTLGRSTIDSVITDNGGPTGLVLLNGGTASNTMFLTANNTYTGNTTIGGGTNASSGVHAVVVGGAAGASIGSANATVLINGGTGGASSGANVLRVGNNDATGNVLGTINIQNGRLSLNRNDTYTLGATVGGTSGMGLITLDSAGNATVNLASGVNSFASLATTAGAAGGTLNLSGTGIYNFNSAWTGFNATSTINYNSGSYYFAATGNSPNVLGNQVINGANVTLAGGRYFGSGGGNLTLNSGTFKVNGSSINMENNGANNVFINVNGGTFIATPNTNTGSLFALAIGSGTVNATGSAIMTQTGGDVNVGVPENNLIASQNVNAGLAIGPTAGSNHTSTYNLSGGTLRVFGGIVAQGAPTLGSNNFNWTGGTLTTVSYNGTNLLGNGAIGTLTQNGSTSVMAPGDFYEGVRYMGRTAIAGNYTILAGTVSLGMSGNFAATTFHESGINRYDNITVTGAANLGGNLVVTLYPGSSGSTFIPAASSVFTVMTYGSRTGTFANSGNKVVLVNDPFDGTLNINYNAANITLSGYVINQWGGTSAIWGTSGGSAWTSGVEPNSAGKAAVFGSAGTANTMVTLDADRTVGQILFNTANYSIGGTSNLTFDNSGSPALITFQDSGTRSITAPIVLQSDLIVVGNATSSLTLGAISGTGRTLTANVSGMSVTLAGNNTYGATIINSGVSVNVGNGGTSGSFGTGAVTNNGTITFNRTDSGLNVSSAISGTGNLTQAGSGVTTLSAANSYTGTTRVDAGTLRLSGTGTLGATTSVLGQISAGAILDLNGTNQTVSSFSGNSTGGFIQNNSGSGTSVLTVGGATNTTFQGQIRDNDGVATGGRVGVFIGGSSNLSLTANNTYSGGTTVGTGATLTINAVSTQSGGVIQGGSTGTGNVTLQAGSTVRNSINSNVWFMDTMRVEGNVTLASTQRLNMTYRTMDLTGGNRTFNVTGRSTGVTGGNTISSDNTGTSQWEMANTTLLGTPVVRDGVMNLQTTFTGTNYGSMRFNNTTTFNNASVIVGNNVLLYLGGSLGTNATNSAAVTIESGGIVNLTAGNRTMGSLAGSGNLFGSMVVTNTNNVTLTLNSASGSSNFGGVLSNGPGNGTLSLVKTGASTQVLSGVNTYNGTTTVSGGGVLRLSAADALSATSGITVGSNATLDITVSDAVNDAATVSLGGGTISKGSGAINETFGALTLTANSTIDFGSGTGSFTFATYTPGAFVLKFNNFDIGNSLTVATGTFNASQFDFNGFGYSLTQGDGFTITAIPEPSAVVAAAAFLGLAGLKLVRRRRKSQSESIS